VNVIVGNSVIVVNVINLQNISTHELIILNIEYQH